MSAQSTRGLLVSLASVIGIFVLAVIYLVTQTLSEPIFHSAMSVTVDLPTTGGLFQGSAVTYRGMKIGTVTQVQLNSDGIVQARLKITDPISIPESSAVKVRSLSPVGEQYIDFQPNTDTGPYLRDGSVLHGDSTDLPKTLASTVVAVNRLLNQINAEDLQTALHGVSTALNGTGPAMARIADQGYSLVRIINKNWPKVQHLAENGSTLLALGVENAGKIDSIARSAHQLGAFLHSFNPTLRDFILNGPYRLMQVSTVVKYLDGVLPSFLSRYDAVTGIVFARLPAFSALLHDYATGMSVLAHSFYDGALRGHLEIADSYACSYGAPQYAPTDVTTHPMFTGGQCPHPSPGHLVRGAQNHPGPAD